MAFFDDQWFTGFQTAATSAMTAAAGAVGAWFALRRKVSSDASAIAEDRQRTGLIGTLREERDDYKGRWIGAMEKQLIDREEIGRLRGLLEDGQERERMLLQQELTHQQKIGACDEKVRGLSEKVKVLQIEVMHLFSVVVQHDPAAADRIIEGRWNPKNTAGASPPPEQIA